MSFIIKSTSPLMEFSDADVDTILKKYERNLNTVQEDIDVIKKWIGNQKHLPATPPEQQIFIFLVMNKFSIENTKEKLDMYYTIRTLIPDYYNNLSPSSFLSREVQKMINLATLPKLSKNLNRVMVFKVVDTLNSNYSGFALTTYLLLFLEIKSLFDVSFDDEYIADFTNFTKSMIARFSAVDVKKIVTIVERVFSNRIGAIHLINLPSYAEAFISLVKSCLKENLRNRFYCHKSFHSLTNYYSKEMLPEDFGGDEKSTAKLHADWVTFLDQQEDHFSNMQDNKSNENLREEKLIGDINGCYGNFKKMAVE